MSLHSDGLGRGQASLEMTLAMTGALLLLFGSFKVFLWTNERLIMRQTAYEQGEPGTGKGGRVDAGSAPPEAGVVMWQASSQPLRIFNE